MSLELKSAHSNDYVFYMRKVSVIQNAVVYDGEIFYYIRVALDNLSGLRRRKVNALN